MSLEARLAALADDAFPPTPDLAGRWSAKPGPQPGFADRRRRWVPFAVAAALLAPAGALAAVELWGPGNVKLRSVETLPPAPPPSGPAGRRVGDLEEAARRVGFTPSPPPFLAGDPTDIRIRGRGVVTYEMDGVTVTQIAGRLFLEKTLGPGTDIERVRVEGREGWFISGARHDVVVETAGGVAVLPRRRAGDVLVYERAGIVVRVEGLRAPPRSPAPAAP